MPKSRSLQSLLAAASDRKRSNPQPIAAKDAEADDLGPLNVPDPEQIGEDVTQLSDAVLGEEGATKKLIKDNTSESVQSALKFIGIGK